MTNTAGCHLQLRAAVFSHKKTPGMHMSIPGVTYWNMFTQCDRSDKPGTFQLFLLIPPACHGFHPSSHIAINENEHKYDSRSY